MVQLTDSEKYLIQSGSEYLKKNDIKKFYAYLNGRAATAEKGHISQFFLENGIDVFGSFSITPDYMFSESEIESIEIPENITRIGKFTFKDCERLTTVTIGEGVKAIDAGAFAGCKNLKQLLLPDSVTVLGSKVFDGCDKVIIYANKRTPANRIRCKQNETPWYRDHLFLMNNDEENTEGGEE